MKLLLAEDEAPARLDLQRILGHDGYEVVSVGDGVAAWEALQVPDSPRLAILDWMMPGIDGVEVCRRVRQVRTLEPPFLILLTARTAEEDMLAGLESGADEYIAKPISIPLLHAHLEVGRRIVSLQSELSNRVKELEQALQNVKQLGGLLPICMYCKKVRDDHNYWQQVEAYIAAHSEAQFSHGICPECYDQMVRPQLADLNPGVADPECQGPVRARRRS